MSWILHHEAEVRSWLVALVATVGAYFAFRAFRREQDRDSLRDRERRQEQAREVSAWVAERIRDPNTVQGPTLRSKLWPTQRYWVVVVNNQSPTPVYDLRARIFLTGRVDPVHGVVLLQVLPLRETDVRIDDDLARGMFVLVAGTHGAYGEVTPEERRDPGLFRVEVTFRDAGDVWWRRSVSGRLEEVPEPP